MVPWLAHHLIGRTHEAMLRRPTYRFTRRLELTQWRAPAELDELRHAKLRALLIHAGERIPFYRHRFREAGVDPRRDDPFDALRRLPLLDKAEIRSHRDELVWPGAAGGLHLMHTGGSTGEPLAFYVDRRRQAADQAARIRTHRWFGVQPGERELWLWGCPLEHRRVDAVKRLRDRWYNHRLLNAFNMSPATMAAYWREYARFKPACVFGYPSSIALWVEHARRAGVQTRHQFAPASRRCHSTPASRRCHNAAIADHLKAVFVTGEACYPHQRRLIESFFGVPVADGYGSRDGGLIAHACELGAMHIMAEHVWVEVLRDDGAPADEDEGEIVVTHLEAYGMPFIRYRTGDRGRLLSGRCACGRGLSMMDAVRGRQTDFIVLPDGASRHALSVIYVMREAVGVERFRITQQEDFSLDVEVVAEQKYGGGAAPDDAEVAASLRRVVGGGVAVRVRRVSDIPCDESGKYRHVISYARCPGRIVNAASAPLHGEGGSPLRGAPWVARRPAASPG